MSHTHKSVDKLVDDLLESNKDVRKIIFEQVAGQEEYSRGLKHGLIAGVVGGGLAYKTGSYLHKKITGTRKKEPKHRAYVRDGYLDGYYDYPPHPTNHVDMRNRFNQTRVWPVQYHYGV